MDIEQKISIHNRFDIHVDNIETGEHKEFKSFNIVLNKALEGLANKLQPNGAIHFGIGSGTPIATRTSLFTFLAAKTAVLESRVYALPISYVKTKIVLNPEEYVNQTITEVGIGRDTSSSSLLTHSLLTDTEGNPISITKTATDVVTIYATLFVKLEDTTHIFWRKPYPPDFLARLLYVPSDGGWSGFPTYVFGLAASKYTQLESNGAVSPTETAYPALFKRSASGRLPITVLLEAQSVYINNLLNFVISDGPSWFPNGQNYSGVSLGAGDGVKKKFYLPSKYVKPETVVGKVNGAVVSKVNRLLADLNYFSGMLTSQGIPVSSRLGIAAAKGYVAYISTGYSLIVRKCEKGAVIKTLPVPIEPPIGNCADVCISKDGKVIGVVHASSPYFSVYDIIDDTLVKRPNPAVLPVVQPQRIAISGDGSRIVLGLPRTTDSINVYIWTGSELLKETFPSTHNDYKTRVAISDDGTKIVGGSTGGSATSKVHLYKYEGGSWLAAASISSNIVTAVAINSDATKIATAYSSSNILSVYSRSGDVITPDVVSDTIRSTTINEINMNGEGTLIAVALGMSGANAMSAHVLRNGAWIRGRANTIDLNGSSWGVPSSAIDDFNNEIVCTVYNNGSICFLDISKQTTELEFDVAPASGAAITTDYTVNGLHKTDQFVVDISFALVFGEGV